MKNVTRIIKKSATLFMVLAFAFGSFVNTPTQFVSVANAAEGTSKVTIVKYIDGVMATATSANSSDFQMSTTWNSTNLGAGSGQYALSAGGFGGDTTPYQAITADMTNGADYTTAEIMDSNVGATCETTPFSLVGYTTGNTLAEAQAATPTLTPPAFTGLTSDKFVIVWNKDCTTPIVTPGTVTVTINKFIDGTQATGTSANNSDFAMNAEYTISDTAGSGTYNLSASGYNGDTTPYQAKTVDMPSGSNYSTNEIMNGVVATDCTTTAPFSFVGYSSGNTEAEAMSAPKSTTPPALTNITNNKYIIVWNHDCANTEGQIGGEVTGGTTPGALTVTSIESTDTQATADGTFTNGWKYIFNITIPTTESHLAMKFANWSSVVGSNTIAAANNIRISSPQADNSNATVLITAANTYSTPNLHMTTDLDPTMPGIQVKVSVEVAIPTGSANGAYTTMYGVKTE